jgi:hypothetical protein
MMPGKGIAQRIERAGADIAENDAHGAHRHLDDAGLSVPMAMPMRRGARDGRHGIGETGTASGLRFTHGIVHGKTAPGRTGPKSSSGPR